VATFNIYGSDHARLQGVATPAYLQRRGHATRLLQQVELLLADAGVQDMVVILEPQVMLDWRHGLGHRSVFFLVSAGDFVLPCCGWVLNSCNVSPAYDHI
jgi:hypothetical protein